MYEIEFWILFCYVCKQVLGLSVAMFVEIDNRHDF